MSLINNYLTSDGKVKSRELLQSFIMSLASTPQEEFFMAFMRKLDDHFKSLNSNTFTTMKRKSESKLKGVFFEDVCCWLCRANAFPFLNIKNVWLFDEFPNDKRGEFTIGTKDMGIDLIAETKKGEWLAIQCKYRGKPTRSHAPNGIPLRWQVNWKDLSTFYSLCARTGPIRGTQRGWAKHVVMTNALTVRRQGRKAQRDVSLCQGRFKNIPKETWFEIAGLVAHRLGNSRSLNTSVVSIEESKLIGVSGNSSGRNSNEEKRKRANAFLDRLVALETLPSKELVT